MRGGGEEVKERGVSHSHEKQQHSPYRVMPTPTPSPPTPLHPSIPCPALPCLSPTTRHRPLGLATSLLLGLGAEWATEQAADAAASMALSLPGSGHRKWLFSRRALDKARPGSAISAVKLSGAQHSFVVAAGSALAIIQLGQLTNHIRIHS